MTFANNPARKFVKPMIIAIVILILVGIAVWFLVNRNNSSSGIVAGSRQVNAQTIKIEKSFDLPTGLEKDGGKALKVNFQNAQITNRITVSGKPRFSKEGTNFLIMNVLIENPNSRRLTFRTRDLVRLVDSTDKKFAPSLYRKDLTLDPDAVKKDVLGFIVPADAKDFRIQYGSPTGDKQIFELKFNQ